MSIRELLICISEGHIYPKFILSMVGLSFISLMIGGWIYREE